MKILNMKVVNKFRFVMFLSVSLIVITFITGGLINAVFAKDSTYKEYHKVFVREGDTVWEIAKENNPYGEDIRKIVYEIKKANNIKDEFIKPGDIIKIPRN